MRFKNYAVGRKEINALRAIEAGLMSATVASPKERLAIIHMRELGWVSISGEGDAWVPSLTETGASVLRLHEERLKNKDNRV